MVLFDAWWWSQHIPDGEAGPAAIDASGWSAEKLSGALG